MTKIDVNFFKKRNRVRNYLHFDKKRNDLFVCEYVTDVKKIERHAFLPTISYILNDKKINRKKTRKDKITKIDYKDKERLINFQSHLDGNIYAYYSKILEKFYEEFLSNEDLGDSVIAFRKIAKLNSKENKYSLCNIHFAKEVFDKINLNKNCTVLCFDISGFFDNLDHEILKKNWCTLLGVDKLPLDHFKVFQSLTEFAYVEKKNYIKN